MANSEEKKTAEVKTPAKKTTTTKKAAAKPAVEKEAAPKASTAKKAAPKAEKVEKATPAKETKVAPKQEVNKEVSKPTATQAICIAKGIGVTPRKARLVIDLVRGKYVEEAYDILLNLNKAASKPVYKAIKSAAANATNNYHMNPANLYVATIYANDGPRLKRYLPRAKGSASGLIKRWCHITVIVKEKGVN